MNQHERLTPDDEEIAQLLRTVGTRDEPPADVSADVERAVHAAWLDVVAARRRRRRVVWAAAASLCAVSIGVAVSVKLIDDQGTLVATLERVDGEIFVAATDHQWTRITPGQRIAVGDSIRSVAPAALSFDDGVSLRIDQGTSLRIAQDDRVALDVGAVYVDSGSSVGDALVISTRAGSVRHIGTRYQVRTRVDGIDVSVREGRVVIESDAGSNVANAGEQLAVSMRGSIERRQISPADAQWRWASDIAPAFVIENASLAAFLEWVGRETGRTVIYESSRAKSVATSEILHGSIDGLAPDVALAAVLASTPLRSHQAEPHSIEIGFAASIDQNGTLRPTP